MVHLVILSNKKTSGLWTTATIAGINLTLLTAAPASQLLDVVHAYALVPSGTTGVVNLVSSSERWNVSVNVYRVVDWLLPPTFATQAISVGPSVSSTIERSVPGVVIAGAASALNGAWTWTGVTQNFDHQVGSERYAVGSEISNVGGPLTASVSIPGGSNRVLSLCEWR